MPQDMPLVPCQLVTLQLGSEHVSTGRAPGVYGALVMPRYISSVIRVSPGPDADDILLGGRRMVVALEYIHKKDHVHMDVKVSMLNMCTVLQALTESRLRLSQLFVTAFPGPVGCCRSLTYMRLPCCLQADNFLVDNEGDWWLADLGGTVPTGQLVEETTLCEFISFSGKASLISHDLGVCTCHM